MEEINGIAKETLTRYFNVLEKTGYVKDSSVYQVILLLFLNDFLNGFQGYITEDDYNKIMSILNCLTNNSCLIPYRQFKESTPVNPYYLINAPIRITEPIDEESNIRITEVDTLRLTEEF